MKKIKLLITFFLFIFIGISINAQNFIDRINPAQQNTSASSITCDAQKFDLNNPQDIPYYIPKANSYQKDDGRWYPVKGISYSTNEDNPNAYFYNIISDDGYLDYRITLSTGFSSNFYDSTYTVYNSSSYSKGKDLIDTIVNFNKNSDGTYIPVLKRVYSYHYFDHFEGDSLFTETLYYTWDVANNQWTNWLRQKVGFDNTLVEVPNRLSDHSYDFNNTWKPEYIFYDSLPRNNGRVDTAYLNRYVYGGTYSCDVKIAFAYNEQEECYYQRKHFIKRNKQWEEELNYHDIEWEECNGFTYTSTLYLFNPDPITPYKKSKIKSYNISYPEDDFPSYYYEKWWNIGETNDTRDTMYIKINGEFSPYRAESYFYNEYGDLIEWRNVNLDYSNGNENLVGGIIRLFPYIYDETYGLVENKEYILTIDQTGILDTTLISGIKYTDFEYYTSSIAEHESSTQPSLILAPNPANENVNISSSEEIKLLKVYNMSGKLIYQQQFPASKSITYNVSHLSKGIYTIHTISASGKSQIGKLMVK